MLGSDVSGAEKFTEGLALVTRGINVDAKSGYVDRTGKAVIPFEFGAARSFVDGLAYVRRGEQWGYIDKTGKLVWKDG